MLFLIINCVMAHIGITLLRDVVLDLTDFLVCLLLKPRILVPVFIQKIKLLNVRFQPLNFLLR